jgi:hypothetical protein
MYHMMREDRGLGLGVRSAARARSDTGRQGGLEAGASSASRVNLACKYATQDDTPVDRPVVVVVRSGLLAVQARTRITRGPPPAPPRPAGGGGGAGPPGQIPRARPPPPPPRGASVLSPRFASASGRHGISRVSTDATPMALLVAYCRAPISAASHSPPSHARARPVGRPGRWAQEGGDGSCMQGQRQPGVAYTIPEAPTRSVSHPASRPCCCILLRSFRPRRARSLARSIDAKDGSGGAGRSRDKWRVDLGQTEK